MRLLFKLTVPAVAVILGAYILPGVHVSSFLYAFLVALLLGFLNSFVKPVLQVLTIPITILTLGIFLIILDAFMIMVADKLLDGFSVDGFWWAVLYGFVLSFLSSVLNHLLD